MAFFYCRSFEFQFFEDSLKNFAGLLEKSNFSEMNFNPFKAYYALERLLDHCDKATIDRTMQILVFYLTLIGTQIDPKFLLQKIQDKTDKDFQSHFELNSESIFDRLTTQIQNNELFWAVIQIISDNFTSMNWQILCLAISKFEASFKLLNVRDKALTLGKFAYLANRCQFEAESSFESILGFLAANCDGDLKWSKDPNATSLQIAWICLLREFSLKVDQNFESTTNDSNSKFIEFLHSLKSSLVRLMNAEAPVDLKLMTMSLLQISNLIGQIDRESVEKIKEAVEYDFEDECFVAIHTKFVKQLKIS